MISCNKKYVKISFEFQRAFSQTAADEDEKAIFDEKIGDFWKLTPGDTGYGISVWRKK